MPPKVAATRGRALVLNDGIRKQCCDMIAEELGHDWIRGDARGTQFQTSNKFIRECLQTQYPGMIGFSVIGGDAAAKFTPNGASVVIGRVGSPLPEEDLKRPLLVVKTDGDTGDFSSTKVRDMLKARNGKQLQTLVGARQAEFLLSLPETVWS